MTFKPANFQDAKEKFRPMKRTNKLGCARKGGIKRKPTEWDRVRAKLKPLFEAAGITRCEVVYDGCWRTEALGFAHDAKRRKWPNLARVVLSCNPCHDILENLGPTRMRDEVSRIINKREVQP